MVIMLAGLRGIDEDVWKASRVDGILFENVHLHRYSDDAPDLCDGHRSSRNGEQGVRPNRCPNPRWAGPRDEVLKIRLRDDVQKPEPWAGLQPQP